MNATNDILKLLCKRLKIELEDLLTNDFENHMRTLRELYHSVKEREIEFIEDENFESLKKTNDPYIITAVEVILFELAIIKKDFAQASKQKKELKELERFLFEETRIWYYKSLGLYEYHFGDIFESNKLFLKARELTNRSNNDAHIEYLLGLSFTRLHQVSKSIYHTEIALKMYNDDINIKRIIDCKLLLGINYNKLGQHQMAEEYYLNIANTLSKIGDRRMLGKIYHNLGYLYSQIENHQKAIMFLTKALDLKLAVEEKLSTFYLLAYEYKNQGQVSKALDLCKEGMKLAENENLNYYYKLYILLTGLKSNGFFDKTFVNKMEKVIIPYLAAGIASSVLYYSTRVGNDQWDFQW